MEYSDLLKRNLVDFIQDRGILRGERIRRDRVD
jgi:hypothetical protein